MKGATSSKSQWSPKRLARTSARPPREVSSSTLLCNIYVIQLGNYLGLFWTWAPSGVCHVKNSDSGWKDLKWMEKGFASGNRQCGAGGMYFLLYDMPCRLIFRLACGSFVSLQILSLGLKNINISQIFLHHCNQITFRILCSCRHCNKRRLP